MAIVSSGKVMGDILERHRGDYDNVMQSELDTQQSFIRQFELINC